MLRDTEVHIAFPSSLKQTKPGKHLQPVTLYEYLTEPKLCPVSLLCCYISKTQTIGKSQTKLLLTFAKLHKAMSSRTVPRWLKTLLKKPGIDVIYAKVTACIPHLHL